MAYGTADLWKHFEQAPKQNQRHFRAICKGCIAHYKANPKDAPARAEPAAGTQAAPVDVDAVPNTPAPRGSQIIEDKERFEQACRDAGSVNGEKSAMIAHILGARAPRKTSACEYAPALARKIAQAMRDSESALQKRAADRSGSDSDAPAQPRKKKARASSSASSSTATVAQLKQQPLVRYKAVDVPFSDQDRVAIQAQALLATVSANLSFRWLENEQVRKLLRMLRARVDDVLPSRFLLSGRLLDNEHEVGEEALKKLLRGKSVSLATDGWKDDFGKDSVTGVVVSYKLVPYLVDVIKSTSHKKDGESMCAAFEAMIDDVERTYGCFVRLLCTDCDGGSKAGRKGLVRKRPWIFGPPCWAHQNNLYLGDYLAENPAAADCGDQVCDILGWIHNHARVRSILNEAQAAASTTVYSYLLANTTRWTTHYTSFSRLLTLKDILRQTVITQRRAIIDAQVGAAKGKKARELAQGCEEICDILDDPTFWRTLQSTAADFEPICLGVNINQRDSVRLDEVLLSIAGMFLHFKRHADPSIAGGMTKRIEGRWKDMGKDQSVFILALVLNPYEKLSRFGPKAGLTPFTLNSLFVETYDRMHSRPPPTSLSAEEKERYLEKIKADKASASKSFFKYLSSTGPFEDFETNNQQWAEAMGEDPVMVWEAMLCVDGVETLAEFAIIILDFVANQGGNERNFSDFKIKKTRLRNRLGLKKLEKMSKIGDRIRREELALGLRTERKRKNHDDERAEKLLAVPRYADALEASASEPEDDTAQPVRRSGRRAQLVKSAKDWRREMAKWQADEKARELEAESDSETDAGPARGRSLIPCTLERLFTDAQPKPRAARPAVTEEERLMELLADELADEERVRDDGELEGSGDDYDG